MDPPAPKSPSNPSGRPFASSATWSQHRTGPKRVGNYLVERELGRGCYGVVYLVQREGLERRFALKVLTAEALRNPETVARFEREAKLASRIQDPGIVPIHDLGREGRFPYYVMDLIRGPTLHDVIRKGPVPAQRAAEIVAALAQTMEAAHKVRVIHRDLKPANVIIDEASGRPCVTDFGLAQEQGGMRLTRTGEAVGTPFYMAPEQNLGQRDLDARVDIYALGVILYECLTGQVPFQGANFIEISHSIRGGQPKPPRSLVPTVPKALEAICLRAMAKDRADRFQTSGALAAALRGFLESSAPGSETPSEAARGGSLKRWLAVAIPLLLVVALGGTGAVVVLGRRHDRQATKLLEEAHDATREAEARQSLAKLAALELGPEWSDRAALEEERWTRRAKLAASLPLARGEALATLLAEVKTYRLFESLREERAIAVSALLLETESQDLAAAKAALQDAVALATDLPEFSKSVPLARLRLLLRRAATLARDPAELKALLDEAAEFADQDALPELARARVRYAKLTYLALARKRAPLSELLQALADAAEDLDPTAEAELGVLKAEAYRRRGRYSLALREAERWSRATTAEVAARAGFVKAFCLLRLDRSQEAMACFEKVASRYASAPSGRLAKSHVAVLARGSARRGLDAMETYTSEFPDDLDGWVLKGACLGRLNRLEEAKVALARAIEVAPDHPRPFLMRGVIQAEHQSWRGALRDLVEAGKRCEGDPFPMLLKVRIQVLHELGSFQEALNDAERFVRIAPQSAAAYVNRAVCRWKLGQRQPALQDLKQALTLGREAAYAAAQGFEQPVMATLRQVEAQMLQQQQPQAQLQIPKPASVPRVGGFLDQARDKARAGAGAEVVLRLLIRAEQEAKDEPARDRVRLERLEILHRRGRYQAVIAGAKPYAKGTNRVALQARFLAAMSALWLLKTEALQALVDVANADPQGAVGLTAMATVLSHQGQHAQGVQHAIAALKKDPDYADAYLSLAFCLHAQGKLREASLVLKQVAERVVDHPRYYKALAFLASSSRQPQVSVQYWSQAIALTQPDPPIDALRRRGWALYVLKKPKEALADALQIVARRPEELAYEWLTGLCHLALGDKAAAVVIWKKCYAKNPQAIPGLIRGSPADAQQAAAAALGLRIERRQPQR
ncbi:MAG: protein kinase [Planctomycetes bacterium]|nr:protein kinase [Planctomycetota bacterium]